MGADPAFVASQSSQQAVSTKGFNPGDIWLTDEAPPRSLVVLGTAGLDPDCLVANFEDGGEGYKGKTLWIVKSSGYVVGLSPPGAPDAKVYASATQSTGNPNG